jgi:hypothetical protein
MRFVVDSAKSMMYHSAPLIAFSFSSLFQPVLLSVSSWIRLRFGSGRATKVLTEYSLRLKETMNHVLPTSTIKSHAIRRTASILVRTDNQYRFVHITMQSMHPILYFAVHEIMVGA